MSVLIATSSADKLREIRSLLGGPVPWLVCLDDLPGVPAPPAEPFDSFRANALHKARWYARVTGLNSLADDSGLRVDALGGAPGVRSRRFAADATGGVAGDTDAANNRLLLERLQGVPFERRTARYVCAAAFAAANGPALAALATCPGVILQHERGRLGFGYDPLFLLPDVGRSFAELTPAEKQRCSHRARAFRALASSLPPRR
ncbi:MAG: non-canonical purine NTP pyrophosphatase [Longimicrobiales bacterium]